VIVFNMASVRLSPNAKTAHLTGWLKNSQTFIGQDRITHRAQLIAWSFSGKTGSTPGPSKTFQPQRCGLISISVIATASGWLHRLVRPCGFF